MEASLSVNDAVKLAPKTAFATVIAVGNVALGNNRIKGIICTVPGKVKKPHIGEMGVLVQGLKQRSLAEPPSTRNEDRVAWVALDAS